MDKKRVREFASTTIVISLWTQRGPEDGGDKFQAWGVRADPMEKHQ